jgi:hypothetical protein
MDGVWGGTTRNQRKRILKAQGKRTYTQGDVQRLDRPEDPRQAGSHG